MRLTVNNQLTTCQKSGKRGSNSRPIAWKAIALPTELLPQFDLRILILDYNFTTNPKSQIFNHLVGRTGFEPVKT